MICKNCGNQMNDGEQYCRNCGYVNSPQKQNGGKKFLPSFILGLMAAVFGICGGFCTTMCTSLVFMGAAPLFLIFGGSIIGLIGACTCLNNVIIGAILELVAGIMIMICAYGMTGAGIMSILAMILFLISGVMGLIYAFIPKQR